TASSLIEGLRSHGSEYGYAADQLMYKRSLVRRQQGADDEATLREIVMYGERLASRMAGEPDAMKDNVVLSVHQVVAEMATEVWKRAGDASMRDIAVQMDTRLLNAQPRNRAALRRLASNADA